MPMWNRTLELFVCLTLQVLWKRYFFIKEAYLYIRSLPSAARKLPIPTLPSAPPKVRPEIPPYFCVNVNDPIGILQQCFPPSMSLPPRPSTVRETVYVTDNVEIVHVVRRHWSESSPRAGYGVLLFLFLLFVILLCYRWIDCKSLTASSAHPYSSSTSDLPNYQTRDISDVFITKLAMEFLDKDAVIQALQDEVQKLRDDKETLGQQSSRQESRNEELEFENTLLREGIEENKKETGRLEEVEKQALTKYDKLQKEYNNLVIIRDSLEQEAMNWERRYSNLGEDKEKLVSDILQLEEDDRKLRKEKKQLEKENTIVKEENKELIQRSRDAIESAQAVADAFTNEILSNIEATQLQGRNQGLQEDKLELQAQIRKLLKDNEAQKVLVNETQDTIKALQFEKDKLEDETVKLQYEKSNLQNEKSKLQRKNTFLQGDKTRLEHEKNTLEASNNEKVNRIRDLEAEVEQQASKLKEEKSKAAGIDEKTTQAANAVAYLKSEVKDLKSKINGKDKEVVYIREGLAEEGVCMKGLQREADEVRPQEVDADIYSGADNENGTSVVRNSSITNAPKSILTAPHSTSIVQHIPATLIVHDEYYNRLPRFARSVDAVPSSFKREGRSSRGCVKQYNRFVLHEYNEKRQYYEEQNEWIGAFRTTLVWRPKDGPYSDPSNHYLFFERTNHQLGVRYYSTYEDYLTDHNMMTDDNIMPGPEVPTGPTVRSTQRNPLIPVEAANDDILILQPPSALNFDSIQAMPIFQTAAMDSASDTIANFNTSFRRAPGQSTRRQKSAGRGPSVHGSRFNPLRNVARKTTRDR